MLPRLPPSSGSTLLQSAGLLVLAVPLVIVAYQGMPVPVPGDSALPRALIVAVTLLLITRALLRADGLSLADLGLVSAAHPVTRLLAGLGAGAALVILCALLLRILARIDWDRNPAMLGSAVAAGLLFHLLTDTCEELAWRGYAFLGLWRVLGYWPAQVIVALAASWFQVLSGGNWPAALTTTAAGSLLFAVVFTRWRSVPAAVGVHAGWDWGRDLLLSSGAATAMWVPRETYLWTDAQWNVARAIGIIVTLLASTVLLRSMAWRPVLHVAASREPVSRI